MIYTLLHFTEDNLRDFGNADDVPAEIYRWNVPTSLHDPHNGTASDGCSNEQGTSSDSSSEQDTSTKDTDSYSSIPNSKIDKHSDITQFDQTLQTTHDLPFDGSTESDTFFIPRSKNHFHFKDHFEKSYFQRPPLSHAITRTHPHDADEQLIYQQTLDLGKTRKKIKRQRLKKRLTATKGEEEPWPNSSDSESKRNGHGHESSHESTGSEVKSKPPNSIKIQHTRAPKSGDGRGVQRDPEQATQSCDSNSVPEDKCWSNPTQETDPATFKSVSGKLQFAICRTCSLACTVHA